MEKGQDQRRRELEDEIREIKRSWPAHTPSPAMFARLEELEEKLISADIGVESTLQIIEDETSADINRPFARYLRKCLSCLRRNSPLCCCSRSFKAR